jgi:DNA polymerase-1
MAINLPIQGLAADIMKKAMTRADNYLREHYSEKSAYMILQIHDELIFEVREDLSKDFAEKIKQEMESVYKLQVPLTADFSIGKNWAEL